VRNGDLRLLSAGITRNIHLDAENGVLREFVEQLQFRVGELQLGRVLDRLQRDEDEGEPFQLLDDPQHPAATSADGQTDVAIDHQAVPAIQQRRGTSRAWLLRTHGVTIVVRPIHRPGVCGTPSDQ
jgi:hypothetical protein